MTFDTSQTDNHRLADDSPIFPSFLDVRQRLILVRDLKQFDAFQFVRLLFPLAIYQLI